MTQEEKDESTELFLKRLEEIMEQANVKQSELSLVLGKNRSTVNKWFANRTMPKMFIIEKLCQYFGVQKSYFLDPSTPDNKRRYYLDPKAVEIAQEIYNNPGQRALFDATRHASPESLKIVADMINSLNKRPEPEDESQDPDDKK